MTTLRILLALFAINIAAQSYAYAQDDEIILPESDSEIIPTSSATPPIMIDESDSNDVSEVEEYDG